MSRLFRNHAVYQLVTGIFFLCCAAVSQETVKTTTCELLADPAKFNHQTIQLTAFFSHGFENSGYFDPTCESRYGAWFEYGGNVATGTIYCCGVGAKRNRPKPLKIEGIALDLTADDRFRVFDELLHRRPSRIVRATVIGTFFAGRKEKYGNHVSWGGYGHLGCCSLLVIRRVLMVEAQDNPEIDYSASIDFPDNDELSHQGCELQYPDPIDPITEQVNAQRSAEVGTEAWAFTDADRVAAQALAKALKVERPDTLILTPAASNRQGTRVYRYVQGSYKYLVEVNKPYVLTAVAADPRKIAWVVQTISAAHCGQSK